MRQHEARIAIRTAANVALVSVLVVALALPLALLPRVNAVADFYERNVVLSFVLVAAYWLVVCWIADQVFEARRRRPTLLQVTAPPEVERRTKLEG